MDGSSREGFQGVSFGGPEDLKLGVIGGACQSGRAADWISLCGFPARSVRTPEALRLISRRTAQEIWLGSPLRHFLAPICPRVKGKGSDPIRLL